LVDVIIDRTNDSLTPERLLPSASALPLDRPEQRYSTKTSTIKKNKRSIRQL
jgi:hypothetical protein